MARAHARHIDDIDEDEDIDAYEEERPESSVSSLNIKIFVALGVVIALLLMIHLRQSNGGPPAAAASSTPTPPPVPPQSAKPAPTFNPAVGTKTAATDWAITKINGAYRANGNRIMGNWTLRDDSDNVTFLSSDEKKALGEALNRYDAQNPH
jgi:hypothetical protein